ncbi:MAG: hypothetical protein P8Z76_08795 [Alphaproteobacteria bacterium]|jgi:uncharacterized protein (DUF2164 family)
MELVNTTRAQLLDYVAAQLDNFFPDHIRDAHAVIDGELDEALDRLR